jgi:periplasmic divalent cation tolerance protein
MATTGKSMPQPYLVITSWPDLDGAQQQARKWVQNKLAASVNILPQMDSIYVWQGELRHGREHKIFIKTSEPRLAALQREIKSAHPYAVAEILEFKINSGNPEYLDWIGASTL